MVSMKQGLRKRQAKRGGMCGSGILNPFNLDVVQLGERRIWDAEVVSSSLTIQTKPLQDTASVHVVALLSNLHGAGHHLKLPVGIYTSIV